MSQRTPTANIGPAPATASSSAPAANPAPTTVTAPVTFVDIPIGSVKELQNSVLSDKNKERYVKMYSELRQGKKSQLESRLRFVRAHQDSDDPWCIHEAMSSTSSHTKYGTWTREERMAHKPSHYCVNNTNEPQCLIFAGDPMTSTTLRLLNPKATDREDQERKNLENAEG